MAIRSLLLARAAFWRPNRPFCFCSCKLEGRRAHLKAPLPPAYGDPTPTTSSSDDPEIKFYELHDPSAPSDLRHLASTSWDKLIPSNIDPALRIQILRKMRRFDWPEHAQVWDSGSREDDARLYRWTDEALGQLFYQKGMWRPEDWTDDDAVEEEGYREVLRGLVKEEMRTRNEAPVRERFGDEVVDLAIRDQPRLTQVPELVWESTTTTEDEDEGKELEWMAQHTADVVFPYLLDLDDSKANEAPRRFWEGQAKKWAANVGGTAFGLDGKEPLPREEPDPFVSRSSLVSTTG